MSDPVVNVWRRIDDNEWALTGEIADYKTLAWQPTYLDLGVFTLGMPYTEQATAIRKGRLVTVDWRGDRSTWALSQYGPTLTEDGQRNLGVIGVGAKSLLGREQAWPDPTGTVGAGGVLSTQPKFTSATPPPHDGNAEDIIWRLVAANYRDRAGKGIFLPPSQNRGTRTRVRPDFQNLWELISRKARTAKIGVDVGLVNTSDTRARLQLLISEPADLRAEIQLTTEAGTLASWEQTETAPTATVAIVGGHTTAGVRMYVQVTTPESVDAATEWGGHRAVFVDGPDSTDVDELHEAGVEALEQGFASAAIAIVAAESDDTQAFTHFKPGDIGTVQLTDDVSTAQTISSIGVTIEGSDVKVEPTFGNPNRTKPEQLMAEMIRDVRREQDRLGRK